MESFLSLLKRDLLNRKPCATRSLSAGVGRVGGRR